MSAATDKQTDFIKVLFTEAQEGIQGADPAVVAQVTPMVESVQDTLVAVVSGSVPDRKAASDAIQALKTVNATIRGAKAAASAPTQLKGADRVIPNRFETKCCSCQVDLATGEGFAANARGRWTNWCKTCASETHEQVEARRQAEHEAAMAHAKAQQAVQAENDAKLAARREANAQGQRDLYHLLTDSLRRAGQAGKGGITVGVALPSKTGNNDLDFFAIHVSSLSMKRTIKRVIGGHADQGLAIDQALDAAERLACIDDFPAAMRLYGQELEYCGKCGRHLTDKASRDRGIGPTCAQGGF